PYVILSFPTRRSSDLGAPGLKRLTEDIVQSDRMGISIAESLRTLAHETRIQRRQAAEELARKAPIKMVPVLIFCVLPALGIVTRSEEHTSELQSQSNL